MEPLISRGSGEPSRATRSGNLWTEAGPADVEIVAYH